MLNEKEFKKLCSFIYRKTGIFIEDKKFKTLSPKIIKLMQEKSFKDFRGFFHALRFNKDNDLLQSLINTVTINETYFFRENYQFEALIKEILPKLDKIRSKDEIIRILCAPSSTGEEPYSVALHLLDEGKLIKKRDIEIIGIDINSNVIQKAKRGIFSKRSVQFLPTHLLNKYFKQVRTNYKIADFLREAITFKNMNVMDKLQMKRLGKFDVIFSRNMLIYFDEKSKKEVAMTFYEMLKPKGYIFLGHAESMNRIVSVFKTIKVKDAIVYQKP